jgi:hypothetical protein
MPSYLMLNQVVTAVTTVPEVVIESMDKCASWEAKSRSVSQKILSPLRHKKVH